VGLLATFGWVGLLATFGWVGLLATFGWVGLLATFGWGSSCCEPTNCSSGESTSAVALFAPIEGAPSASVSAASCSGLCRGANRPEGNRA